MHEIGHYILQTESEEKADSFSASIIAPPAIILDMGLRSADKISRYFGLSVSAANNVVIGLREYNINDGAELIYYFRSLLIRDEIRYVPIMQGASFKTQGR